jgi:large subunit ribosomal protein L35
MLYYFGAWRRGSNAKCRRPGRPHNVLSGAGDTIAMKKYKLKTHKATAKRVRMTGGGKYMHLKSARTKYRRKKDPTRNRALNQLDVMAKGDTLKMKRLLPYA